jgi:hypothetical protein
VNIKMKIRILLAIIVLCVSMSLSVSSKSIELLEENSKVDGEEYGVWIHTTYDGVTDSTKLDIDLQQFSLMLRGGGWVPYTLSMENPGDTTVNLRFVRTKIYLQDGSDVDVIQTQFNVETKCDTRKDFEVALEVRFPFSILKSSPIKIPLKIPILMKALNLLFKNTDSSYFSLKVGYSSPQGDEGPSRVDTRFFFGKESLRDPMVLRMKITPYDLGRRFKMRYFNSYKTIDEYGYEAFSRSFAIDFEPAAELQITSIPREAKISYNFGSSAGVATKISFSATGGRLSDIVQSFIIDPLPEYMSFDLTVLGERFFRYESDTSYSVTYIVDSVQDGNLVKLELFNLPTRIEASWGLAVSAETASGFIDLDMSNDIGRVSLCLRDEAFMEILNFPRRMKLKGYLDIPNLRGHITTSKYSGSSTILRVPMTFDKWKVMATIKIEDGYGRASFDLPSQESAYTEVGLDTNGDVLLGMELSVVDMEKGIEVLYVNVEGVATDNFKVSWGDNGTNFRWLGRITKLINLFISINFKGFNFDISSSWTLGEKGFLEIRLKKDLKVTFVDIETSEFKLFGHISLYGDRFFKVDWEWGETGHFTIYAPEPIGKELYLEFGCGPVQGGVYKYGLKITATDFLWVTRTIMWDTENGVVPRIWVLGDKPLPGEWDVWLLWNYKWYEVK